jgi:hypothetical protein
MLLTDHEREFLAVFTYEATTDPFKGPTTEELHRRNIWHDDLLWLMAAYDRENPADQQGFGGKPSVPVPACPWPTRDLALQRDREVQTQISKNTQAIA